MRVLAISAHPDDETLGCGGTLIKHQSKGTSLFWLVVTETRAPLWPEDVIERKAAEVKQVAEAYMVDSFFKLGFPAARLDTVPIADLMKEIEVVLLKVRPSVVYLVNGGDVHTDHRVVFDAATSVLKPINMSRFGVRRLLCYETLSSTEAAPPHPDRAFVPVVFSDITAYMDRKIEIMSIYESEAQSDPLPRGPSAIRALARYRGASIGVQYAEAFALIREVP